MVFLYPFSASKAGKGIFFAAAATVLQWKPCEFYLER
jgi:hypothetical protein